MIRSIITSGRSRARSRAARALGTHACPAPQPAAPAAASEYVLAVELEAPGGRRWRAIGGGASVDDALAFARASSPAGFAWRVAGWRPVFGE